MSRKSDVGLINKLLGIPTWTRVCAAFSVENVVHPQQRRRCDRVRIAMGRGAIGAPIARLLANMIVMGSGVLGRHFLQAYQEALKSALHVVFLPIRLHGTNC